MPLSSLSPFNPPKCVTGEPTLRKATNKEKVEIQGYCHDLALPIEKINFSNSRVLHHDVILKTCIFPPYVFYDLIKSSSADGFQSTKEKPYTPLLIKSFAPLSLKAELKQEKERFEALKAKGGNTHRFAFYKTYLLPNKPKFLLKLVTPRPDRGIVEQMGLSEEATPLLTDHH
jgi:hypothetical protein